MRVSPALALLTLMPLAASAADLNLTLEIPSFKVAEYHQPYVAIWIEREDHSTAANLAVWYQIERKRKGPPDGAAGKPRGDGKPAAGPGPGGPGEESGTKWLAELRQWWRRSGRQQTLPIDGVSGATRTAGKHQLAFSAGKSPLGDLAPGNYQLIVEAAREVGSREVLSVPLQWPPTQAQHLTAQGSKELGAIAVDLKP